MRRAVERAQLYVVDGRIDGVTVDRRRHRARDLVQELHGARRAIGRARRRAVHVGLVDVAEIGDRHRHVNRLGGGDRVGQQVAVARFVLLLRGREHTRSHTARNTARLESIDGRNGDVGAHDQLIRLLASERAELPLRRRRLVDAIAVTNSQQLRGRC
jgi:hypothetical protein